MKVALLRLLRSIGKLTKAKHGGYGNIYCVSRKVSKCTIHVQISVFKA